MNSGTISPNSPVDSQRKSIADEDFPCENFITYRKRARSRLILRQRACGYLTIRRAAGATENLNTKELSKMSVLTSIPQTPMGDTTECLSCGRQFSDIAAGKPCPAASCDSHHTSACNQAATDEFGSPCLCGFDGTRENKPL